MGKASFFDLNYTTKHGYKNQSCLKRTGDLHSGRTLFPLQCKGLQKSVSIDKVDKNDHDDWSSETLVLDVGRKFREQMNTKNHVSPKSYIEGPFVENEEEINNEILQHLCNKGRLMDAPRLIDVMARRSQIPNFSCCTNLIRGFIKVDQINKAARILKIMVMSGGVPDVITYNMMVGGLCKRGKLKSAIDLLEDMSLSGCPPDVVTYNTIIRCMFHNANFDQAVRFWKEQLRRGCPPYLITYTILIELVCKHCGTVRAMEVLEDMAIEGCYPDLVTYNSLVNFTCKQGKYEDAALIIINMLSHGMEPNAITYNTLLHSLCSCGLWDEVDEILTVMKETSHPPTVVTYNTLINGLCKSGLVNRAIDFFHQMVYENCLPDIVTYNTLLGALCKEECWMSPSSQFEDAVEILREMGKRDHRINSYAYRSVIDGLCNNKKTDIAIQVLEIMISSRCKPDEEIYSALINSLADAGMMEEANELRQKLINIKVLKDQSILHFL
ncbi:pentatricopeptide repeat-containing protein, putative [Ricinus communis]|uniref:Pentatricopeptide repeat-containing protein, putative n=1 Tax=Ricinus communis TaxID=3988 RepID=B9S7L0_RICCO|nr:pentatricopeptide repeat-containing protein, putative [Ricinus communis]